MNTELSWRNLLKSSHLEDRERWKNNIKMSLRKIGSEDINNIFEVSTAVSVQTVIL
jgi:hypothetical protein